MARSSRLRCLLGASVPVVVFALVTNSTHKHVVANDLEEGNVACCAERDHKLA
jgi:hypothetical protein